MAVVNWRLEASALYVNRKLPGHGGKNKSAVDTNPAVGQQLYAREGLHPAQWEVRACFAAQMVESRSDETNECCSSPSIGSRAWTQPNTSRRTHICIMQWESRGKKGRFKLVSFWHSGVWYCITL